MFDGFGGTRVRVSALMAAFALAAGMAACGSDDGDGNGDASANDGGAGGAEQQVKDDYDTFIENIYQSRWKKACDGFSTRYHQEGFPSPVTNAPNCLKSMPIEFAVAGVQPRPWIARVELKGPSRAIGYSKWRRGGSTNPVMFVKEDGSWKVDVQPKAAKGGGSQKNQS